MSQYDSSIDDQEGVPGGEQLRSPFLHDYYLSNSIDVFQDWKATLWRMEKTPKEHKTMHYLELELPVVSKIEKFRTADIIRCKAFVHMLVTAFEEVSKSFQQLFQPSSYGADRKAAIVRIKKESVLLQSKLEKLLSYLQVANDQRMQEYYNTDDVNFQQYVFGIISKLYLYATSLRLLWDVSGSEIMLVAGGSEHSISLGGNHSYYKNIMRSVLKRNWHIKEVYDLLQPELSRQRLQDYEESTFLVRVICEVLSLQAEKKVTEKEKIEFIDCMKGLYFLEINLKKKGIYEDYLLSSFHLEVLSIHKMFKDYEDLESMYINLLEQCKKDCRLMELVYTLEMDKLPFEKRSRIPEIELRVMDIACNYIAVTKGLLQQLKIFPTIKPILFEQGYASSAQLLKQQNFIGLVSLLMSIQQNSKDAFSQGDISVHKIYLQMSELIKQIYLSYQHSNWLFPSDILLCIPLSFFMNISDDIKADVKKTLFVMVETINEDRMPFKLSFENGKVRKQRVERSEYLQVILYFLFECRQQEQYINLPEILPTNIETSILYIRSLHLKLNEKEPTPDQMPYVMNILKTCESYKLTIKFRWYQIKQSIEDREIEFNIEKGLPEDWMRKIYRQTLNRRESEQVRNHFDKYLNHKQLTILNLASIFKYCHGLNPGKQIGRKQIREQDLFTLLQQIKMLLSIRFDIFNLNLDEEISLNYIHVCLSLYNSCYDETPFNEAYLMIMDVIMKPYLRGRNSSLTNFRQTYPGFFEKWIYSFQIATIFQELGGYISEKGQEEDCREDIINKIKMVRGLIDNKENIKQIMNVQDLTEIIVLFSTLISRQAHPLVYIECAQLFCLFLNIFPEVRKEATLDFMLDPTILADERMVSEIISYIKRSEAPYLKDEISIMNNMVKNLTQYMNEIGLKRTNQILTLYSGKQEGVFDEMLISFTELLFTIQNQQATLLTNVLRLVFVLKQQFEAEKEDAPKKEILVQARIIESSLKYLQEKGLMKPLDMPFCEIIFLEDGLSKIDRSHDDYKREGNQLVRDLLHGLIKRSGVNQDIIYFAQKLDLFDLILIGKRDSLDSREQSLLLDLLMQTKFRANQTELIKKLLRENSRLSEIGDRAVQILSRQRQRIHCYHLNKFIHINNRYPKERIEQFIIENIGCERNHSAVRITQPYLIRDLVRKLEKAPRNICQELLLKPIQPEQEQLIDYVSELFEKLLYLPIDRFENVKMKNAEQIQEENEDWNTESEGEKEQEGKSKETEMDVQKKEEEAHSGSQHEDEDNDSAQNDQQEGEDYDRPPIVGMFIEQDRSKQFQFYSRFMVLREQLDVLIDSRYCELTVGSSFLTDKEVVQKLMGLVNMLNQMQENVAVEIAIRMPPQLFVILKIYGLVADIDETQAERIKKMKKTVKKPPKWMLQLFSDRQESDDSNVQGSSDEDDEYSGDDEMQDEDEPEGEMMNEDSDSESDSDSDIQVVVQYKKPKKSSKPNKKPKQRQLPGLVPTYSKVQQQIKGNQLKKQDLIKILEISLYWLLLLPQSQVKTKQVTSYYLDILKSNLGPAFFQSFMTVIRFNQTKNNLQSLLRSLKQRGVGKVQVGLQSVSLEQAVNNILYLLREYQKECRDKPGYNNLLFKESGSILPIAEHIITQFDLPIQNNCITLLLLYISNTKQKIRNKIQALDYSVNGEGEQINHEYKLKQNEMNRIIDKICKHGSNNHIWEIIEATMNLKVKNVSKLFNCIKGYGGHLHQKLIETGQKILKTIKNVQGEKLISPEHQHLRNVQNTHHIISKLIATVRDPIKQFYFINKQNLKQIMQQQNQDLYQQIQVVKNIPKRLLQQQEQIFKSRTLISLVEIVIYFIKMLKDQFYGKIEDKLFNKLIHYPKMIIESVWYYIFIFNKHQQYTWNTPSQIEIFFRKYPFIGTYQFSNLQEVFGLVIYFFNLEPFCADKFKQYFLPILMKNHQLSNEIPLMFKVPKTGEEEEYITQSIVVTRKCSFDMAFYQVVGQAIQVQFHEEEGSDHGGLVRELMIGWKGRGVGQQAFFIGKILGISFRQGVPYGGSLDIGMFVAITNFSPTLDFFKEVDPEIYKSLKYIQQNDPQSLCLRFVVEHMLNGKLVEYELIEGGKSIDLVQANKHKYLEAYLKKYFYLGREEQLSELKLGFNTVVFPEYAQIFTPLQMLRQIRGEQIVDVKMLISKVKYQGYSAESAVIRWLWSIVESFDQQKMNTFIQFVTGSPKITVYNSNFSITIEKVYDVDCLPVAHTCFNTIDLPEYSTRQILEKKFLTAIFEGNNSFGIL